LIEENDAIQIRIEKPSMIRLATRARPAVHEQNGYSLGITTLLYMEFMRRFDR